MTSLWTDGDALTPDNLNNKGYGALSNASGVTDGFLLTARNSEATWSALSYEQLPAGNGVWNAGSASTLSGGFSFTTHVGIGKAAEGQSGFHVLDVGGAGALGLVDLRNSDVRQVRLYSAGSDGNISNVTNGGAIFVRTTDGAGIDAVRLGVSASTISAQAPVSVNSLLVIGSNVTTAGAATDIDRLAFSVRRNISNKTQFNLAAQILARSDTSVPEGSRALDVHGILSHPSTDSMHVMDAIQATAKMEGKGHVDNLTGVYGWVSVTSDGTVVNARALRAGFDGTPDAPSVGTVFGLYVDNVPTGFGTNKIAIWTSDGEVQFSAGSFVYSKTSGVKWGNGPYISSSSSALGGSSSNGSAYLLARVAYHPASAVTTVIGSSTTVALDSSNISVRFTAPSSGSVYAVLKASAVLGTTDSDVELNWGLLGDTASVVSSEVLALRHQFTDNGTTGNDHTIAIYAAVQTRDIAVSGTTSWVFAHRRRIGGNSPATAYGGRQGPAVIEIWAIT